MTQRADRWLKLRQLARHRQLTGQQADELADQYIQTVTDLSQLRSTMPEPSLITELSVTAGLARQRLLVSNSSAMTVPWHHWFTATMPLALYRIRWWIAGAAGLFGLVSILAGWWVTHDLGALSQFGSAAQREAIANQAFADYYSEYSHSSFAAMVWTNNAFLAALCLASGITGVGPVLLLFNNAVQIGATGGLMISQHAGFVFFSLITPHGLLELCSVFAAAAAGFQLFWSVLVPGPRRRSDALLEQGRHAPAVIGALAISLALSALIEAVVTPSAIVWWMKSLIGVLVLAVFWCWVIVYGRRATRLSQNTDQLAASQPVAG